MDHYDFAAVYGVSLGVGFYCTDQSELDGLTKQLNSFFPRMRIHITSKLPSGETYSYFLKELSGRDIDAAWWIVKQLCGRGWEPLGGASIVSGSDTSTGTQLRYQFRRKRP